MTQTIGLVTLLVADYAAAVAFFVESLGFRLSADIPMPDGKRWVVVHPVGAAAPGLLLARAADDRQRAMIGGQGAGRVFLFLETDDFARDHAAFLARGVRFLEPPRFEPYGTVAVFADCCGNLWDLIEHRRPAGEVDQPGVQAP